MRKRFLGAAAALALVCPSAVLGEPLTLDIALGLERYGRIAIDPSGAVGVFEERRARSDLPRHDVEAMGADRYARLYRIDLEAPFRVAPLLQNEADAGYTMGPFSPDGDRLAVYRLQNDLWRLGIVELGTGAVVWTDIAPDTGLWGRALEWVSEDRLIVLGTTDGTLPPRLAGRRVDQERLLALRAAASAGEAAAVSVGVDRPAPPLEERRLWTVEAATGHAAPIAEGPIVDFELSPDGGHAALLLDGPLLPPESPDVATEVRRARSLRILSLADGSVVSPPQAANISTNVMTWAPDSSAVLVVATDTDRGRLLSISAAGVPRDVTPQGVAPSTPIDFMGMVAAQAGWLGDTILMRGGSGATAGWYRVRGDGAERLEAVAPEARLVAQGSTAVLFDDRTQIIRLTADGSLHRLGRPSAAVSPHGPFGNRGLVSPMKARQAVVQGDAGQVCRVQADIGGAECVTAGRGAAVSWSRGMSLGRGIEGPDAGSLVLSRHGERTPIWRLNPELDAISVAAPRLLEGPGGVRGWLYLPPISEAPPPVIVVPYQGATNPTPPYWMDRDATELSLAPQLLVAEGYAVVVPDLPPTPEPADGIAQRMLAVVDVAADQHLIDPERVGLWGWSFGAWSSLMGVAQSPRFSAVVGLNGPMNLASSIGDLGIELRLNGENDAAAASMARWLESGQARMRSAYWSAPDRYRRNSPFEQADRISAPVLLVVGEYDSMIAQSELLYGALHRLNRPVALTVLYGEAHGVQNPGNVRLYYSQVVAWFDHHLRGAAPPGAPSTGEATPR
nr:prolyl oligopeptidase family serine peptidase [uncultured Brevundimonas sp.]